VNFFKGEAFSVYVLLCTVVQLMWPTIFCRAVPFHVSLSLFQLQYLRTAVASCVREASAHSRSEHTAQYSRHSLKVLFSILNS
jgi:hypothetical protein